MNRLPTFPLKPVAAVRSCLAALLVAAALVPSRAAAPSAAVPPSPARASTTNAPAGPVKPEFQSFRLISDRNIFNPKRTARTARAGGAAAPRPARTETFTLVGLMAYGSGTYAVFDGSSSQYRGVLKPGASIAGHQIKDISPKHVILESGGKSVEMRLGSQMRRQDDEPWSVSDAAVLDVAPTVAASATNGAADSSGGAENDVIRRMMLKREQETTHEK